MVLENLTLPIIIGAALLDSINPCVFGVLIFLIGFMTKLFKSPNRMLLGGLIYTSVVYVTYLVLGLGFLKFTVSFGFSVAIYWIAAVIAILAGIFEMKDFFAYGRGFSLQMIPGAANRIKYYTQKMKKLREKGVFWVYLAAIPLGIFVTLVELPCTGAPYLAVLAIIGKGNYAAGLPLLLLYNLIFILPLFVIIGIAYFGKSSSLLEKWRKKHRGVMRLAVGLFLITLGGYMIYTVW
jgi:cytochrome c biogenesis protein CcdA